MKRFFIFSVLFAVAAAALALARLTPFFADFYRLWIFPVWLNTYGRLTGLSGMSVGEIMINTAAGIVGLFVLLLVLGLLILLIGRKKGVLKLGIKAGRLVLDLAVIVFLFEVLNCFVLYSTHTIYSGSEYESFKGNNGHILALREMLVKRANDLSLTFERDENGDLIYKGDMGEVAAKSMSTLGEAAAYRFKMGNGTALDNDLRLLAGFYSKPKPFWKSDFFSQQNIAGYYFPFSLEANYNDLMYISNTPSTMCHELAHLKGFIREDEANFLSYLACIGSGDSFFEYSGILMALSHVNQYVLPLLDADGELYDKITKKNDLVVHDCIFLTSDAWEQVEKDALIDTKTVAKVSDDFINTNLTMNGVEDGDASYSRVVDLLLKYYYFGEEETW